MNSGIKVTHQLAVSLVVAFGLAILWFLLVGWGGMVIGERLWPKGKTWEQIVITEEGIPLIRTSRFLPEGYYAPETYRTVDGHGQAITNMERRKQQYGKSSTAPIESPRFMRVPLPWCWRIAALTDFGQPPNGWYLLRDDRRLGQATLVGYDMVGKHRVGYIGRNGFSSNRLSREDCFLHGDSPAGWQGRVCSTGNISYSSTLNLYRSSDTYQDIPQWCLFLIDGEELREIDLRSRQSRSLYHSPDMVSIEILSEKADVEGPGEHAIVRRLLLRLADRLVKLDVGSGRTTEYKIPDSMKKKPFSFYSIDGGGILLMIQTPQYGKVGRSQHQMARLSPKGDIECEETVSLLSPVNTHPPKGFFIGLAGFTVPSPLAWTAIGGLIGPIVKMQRNEVPDYGTGLRKAFSEGWPGLLIVMGLALASAGIALRLHRKYHRPRPALWWWFVFLLGPAGLWAYWLGHPRAVLEPCGSCGQPVPRDRDGCAQCGQPFAAPVLLGTEVFA